MWCVVGAKCKPNAPIATIHSRDKKPIKWICQKRKKEPKNVFHWLVVGGKKNRQKERRLLKGFNLALPATAGMNTLPPVSEFGTSFSTSFQGGGGCGDNSDYYGSAFAGLMNTTSITPRRNHMYSMQQFSSSQSSFSDTFGTIGRLGKIGSKLRNTSQKRRWGECRRCAHKKTIDFLVIAVRSVGEWSEMMGGRNRNLCELKWMFMFIAFSV